MPSNYAHYRFGKEVLPLLPKEVQRDIKAYRGLFDIGLHGPDILYYYRPLLSNKVSRKGFTMHDEPGMKFFKEAGERIFYKKYRIPYLVYMYGFICHFILDSESHGYIDQKIEESGMSHAEIEVEFDRVLMVEDAHDPLTYSLADHIYPTQYHAAIIATFFDGITAEQVVSTLKGVKWYNQLLIAPHHLKRGILYGLLKIVGKYKQMKGLIVNYQQNPQCEDSNETLRQLYEKGIPIAKSLICEYEACIEGKKEFNPRYHLTFGADLKGAEQSGVRV